VQRVGFRAHSCADVEAKHRAGSSSFLSAMD
jgi:hypothetical protein